MCGDVGLKNTARVNIDGSGGRIGERACGEVDLSKNVAQVKIGGPEEN